MTAATVVGFGIEGLPDELPATVGDAGPAVVGLYLPPWEAFLARADSAPGDGSRPQATSDDWAADWLAWHRELVGLYESAPDRVHLVNAGRLEGIDALAGHLSGVGVELDWPAGAALPELSPGDVPVARVLASAMAEACRPLWEQYQALEACAVLLGREPEFLGSTDLPDIASPDALLAALRDVQRDAGDARAESANADASQARASAGRRADGAAALAAELRQENELLGLQLQQLHEELHFQLESGKQLRRALAEAEETATSARLVISSLATRGEAPA